MLKNMVFEEKGKRFRGHKVIKAVRVVKDFKGIRVVIYVKDSITYIDEEGVSQLTPPLHQYPISRSNFSACCMASAEGTLSKVFSSISCKALSIVSKAFRLSLYSILSNRIFSYA